MAEKRMFTKKITNSDAFLDLPLSSQCLYFHLNMEADDDGFINSPKRLLRIIGASEDDLKLLIAKNFLLVFESGVIVIKHWRLHNTIKKDRYHPTDYIEEYQSLGLKDNGVYSISGEWNQVGTKLEPENRYRLDKNRLDKNNKAPKRRYGEYQHVMLTDEEYRKLYESYYELADRYIDYLDEYIEMKGYKAKNHYLAIKKWVIVAVQEEEERKRKHITAKASQVELPDYDDSNNPTVTAEELEELRRSIGGQRND